MGSLDEKNDNNFLSLRLSMRGIKVDAVDGASFNLVLNWDRVLSGTQVFEIPDRVVYLGVILERDPIVKGIKFLGGLFMIIHAYYLGKQLTGSQRSAVRDSMRKMILACALSGDECAKKLKSDYQKILAYAAGDNTIKFQLEIISGWIRRLTRNEAARARLRDKRGKRAWFFLRSIYESKRTWPVLPLRYKAESVVSHGKNMTCTQTLSTEAENWIRRAVRIVIREPLKEGLVAPTHAACYTTGRRGGGNKGEILVEREIPLNVPWDSAIHHSEIQRGVALHKYLKDGRAARAGAFIAIPEPGKFRCITAGDSACYTGLRGLQKYLIRQWKNMSIGTMRDGWQKRWQEVVDRTAEEMREKGEVWVNGDYKDATDFMKLEATLVAVDEICKILNLDQDDPLLALAFRESFGGILIDYKRTLKELRDADPLLEKEVVRQLESLGLSEEKLMQTNGQLMGHPLSFPLLCIINYSTWLRTTCGGIGVDEEEYLRINGDDITFRTRPEKSKVWEQNALEVGLQKNSQKTYTGFFSLINSEQFLPGQGLAGYLPVSAAYATSVKNTASLDIMEPASYLQVFRRLVGRQGAWLRHKIIDSIKAGRRLGALKHLSWYLPQWLGGLGLDQDRADTPLSLEQRQLAKFLKESGRGLQLVDKVTEQSSRQSQLLLSKLRPPVQMDGRRQAWQGPLLWRESEEYLDLLKSRCEEKFLWTSHKEVNVLSTVRKLERQSKRWWKKHPHCTIPSTATVWSWSKKRFVPTHILSPLSQIPSLQND